MNHIGQPPFCLRARLLFALFACGLAAASCMTSPSKSPLSGDGSPEVVSGPTSALLKEMAPADGSTIIAVIPTVDIPDYSHLTYEMYKSKAIGFINRFLADALPPKIAKKIIPKIDQIKRKQTVPENTSQKTKNSSTTKAPVNQKQETAAKKNTNVPTDTSKVSLSSAASKETSAPEDRPLGDREVRANPGDDIEISFNRDGWIFLGFDKTEDSKGISFQSRKSVNNQTVFSFKANAPGSYDLGFSRQDNSSRTESRENVLVYVEDAGAAAARKLSAATAGKTGDELYNQKLYSEALAKYLENYTEGSQSLDYRIADTYKRTGNIDQAIKFFQKNLAIPGEYADKAAVEIAKLYTDKKDRQGFDKYMNQISGIDADLAGKYVTLIAKYLEKNGENASGIKIVSDFLATHPRARNTDELFFLLGNFYEKDTPVRDLKKSWMYYRKVCDDFPESMFLDASQARITYLNRYFFIIK